MLFRLTGREALPKENDENFKLAYCGTEDPNDVKYRCSWYSEKDVDIFMVIRRNLEEGENMIGFSNGTHYKFYPKCDCTMRRSKSTPKLDQFFTFTTVPALPENKTKFSGLELAFCNTEDPYDVKYRCSWYLAEDVDISMVIKRILEEDVGMLGFRNGSHYKFYQKSNNFRRSRTHSELAPSSI